MNWIKDIEHRFKLEEERNKTIKSFDRYLLNQLTFNFDNEFWNSMDKVPHHSTQRYLLVLTDNNRILKAHWAEDLSGSEQPAFSGWFADNNIYCYKINPIAWKLPDNIRK